MEKKKNIRSLTKGDLKKAFTEMGEKSFRATQVYEWLWQKNAANFDEMTNLSVKLREQLKETFFIDHITLDEQQVSSDRTIKCAFNVGVGKVVEGVLIPTKTRMTACISSQVGCSLACKFCATGKLKLLKNLSAGEIVDQVVHLKNLSENKYNQNLSNIVYMGMGEPLLNYKNMLESIDKITSEEGLGMSPKRITVSTAGIAKMIKKLGDDEVKFNLALSLHAANDKKRNKIMAINETNNLEVLAESLRYFYGKTGTRVTYEYIIFRDFNDELEDAQELAEFCKIVPCKVNIIEYNPIDDGEFQQADAKKVDRFAAYLENKNIIVNVRRSRGKDIDAACGQLANKNEVVTERMLK
ncbi:23S rRNA (adenine(2503)-C(2))-methyltransferase RlmN [Brumimicrobium aurantiacum]|uniref:Probable dual-specificity RNA methyltransferase RlmN n=1 Tax=Brumimicrobium aurantiacum TaxID=1737063 RepID=A0A3E1EXC0_9FLAO|nr:23S rRNA (adenine(2503)-C(2))-methyltransferase RlmN [Brumimicrobium aurantiacum]RFC54211.1 23S rRNA (adenine(2503)-C(2))-methyltransferase RlmN [Brumimicrobium aurantiacum]